MKLFTAFNFDIIIIIIAIFGIILGIYRGGYKQIQKTSTLLIPLIILYFLFPLISKIFISNDNFVAFAKLFIFPNWEVHLYLIINLFIGIIMYFFFAMIVHLTFKLLQSKNIDYYLIKKKKFGRVIAPFISLLSSYIIIFIVLYLSGPFINNTNKPVTSFLENSSLSINEIATSHLYQNKYSQEFSEANELYDYLSSEGISKSFNYYSILTDSINEIEQLINNQYDNLHDDSKDLLRNEKTVDKLIELKNDKYIVDLVWKIEKKTGFFDEIYAKRNYMIDNIGFIKIINSEYYTLDDQMINQIIENKDGLTDVFVTKASLNRFLKMINYYEFYLDNKVGLHSLLDLADLNIFEYREKINKVFADNSLMFSYINEFNSYYENSENKIIQDIIILFEATKENQVKILEIDEHMNFASRFVISKNYKTMQINKEWLNKAFVRGYFIDGILNRESQMHLAYKDMLFVYLLPEYSVENKVDIEDINSFIINLNFLVEKKLLYSRDKNNILTILFMDNDFIVKMMEKELISIDTVEYAKGLIV